MSKTFTQIKIFKGYSYKDVKDESNVEKQVNDWLKEHIDLEIVDIKYEAQTSYSQYNGISVVASCMVIYRETTNDY